jgi:hypothetical protein
MILIRIINSRTISSIIVAYSCKPNFLILLFLIFYLTPISEASSSFLLNLDNTENGKINAAPDTTINTAVAIIV